MAGRAPRPASPPRRSPGRGLSRLALRRMMDEEPAVAVRLLAAVSQRMAKRLRDAGRQLKVYHQLSTAMQGEIDTLQHQIQQVMDGAARRQAVQASGQQTLTLLTGWRVLKACVVGCNGTMVDCRFENLFRNMTLCLPPRALTCVLAAALPLLIGGCASRRTPEAAPPAPLSTASGPAAIPAVPGSAATPPTATSAQPLAGEGRWLRSLFSGTPVGIADEPHGVLRLTVPLAHGFEPASAAPKPALKAVLDRVGQSLLRQGGGMGAVGGTGAAGPHRASRP